MKKMVCCFTLALLALSTHAQSTINSSGNSNQVNGNTYSYSIGEMTLVHTDSASNLVITQGVLQGFEEHIGIEALKLTENEFKVYPNPTKDVLNLESNLSDQGNLLIKLYDLSGKELVSKVLKLTTINEKTQLNLQPYGAGNYVLYVEYKLKDKVAYQNYKIQKLN